MHSEKKGPAGDKKEREESVLMSQSEGRQVTHMVPLVLAPGAEGDVNHSHRRGFQSCGINSKAAEWSPAAEQKALHGRGLPPIKG